MQGLTPRQREIWEFIRDTPRTKGFGPSVREIGAHFGIKSPNGVMGHLRAMKKKGAIQNEPNRSRTLVVVYAADQGMPCESALMRERNALLDALHAARELVKAEGDPRWGWQRRLDGILVEAIERAEGPGGAG